MTWDRLSWSAVMSFNHGRVKLGMLGTSVLSCTWIKHINCQCISLIWEPVNLKSPQITKILWQYISFQVTDGRVVRAGISVTWDILSCSGGHEFEPRSDRTWGAWYICPKSYLNQTLINCTLAFKSNIDPSPFHLRGPVAQWKLFPYI